LSGGDYGHGFITIQHIRGKDFGEKLVSAVFHLRSGVVGADGGEESECTHQGVERHDGGMKNEATS
jgi:hypothetical protein